MDLCESDAVDRQGEESFKAAPILRRGETCWRIARADRFALIVDAADYFAAARSAMLKAEHSIPLVGWDFDLRIDLLPEGREGGQEDGYPTRLGDFLKAIVRRKPWLRIFILKWDMAVLYTLGNQMLPVFALDLMSVERIKMRFDSTHPWMSAHHQKIVVIDDALAFCGGIDMTTDRWDTRRHLPGDERRRRPDGSLHGPWHDATTVVDGAAAGLLGKLVRERWRFATGRSLKGGKGTADLWPDAIRPQLRDVDVAVARTMPAYEGRAAVREIEELYLAAIRSAKRWIYLESQYFASVSICDAIAGRLAEPGGPEVVVINPLSQDGWLEQVTMGTARSLRLASVAAADRHDRFAIFHPVDEAGDPIYVHAKILIVDDELLRVGSSNVNNRSLGFDTECDLAVEAGMAQERSAIAAMRNDLLAEHLDVDATTVAAAIERCCSLLGAVEALRRPAGRSLRPLPRRPVNDAEEILARSHLADPERPKDLEGRLEHIAKRLVLRVPPSAWLALSAAGLAAISAVLLHRRGRRRRHEAAGRRRHETARRW